MSKKSYEMAKKKSISMPEFLMDKALDRQRQCQFHRRRVIQLQPNCVAWLHAGRHGGLPPVNREDRLNYVRGKAQVTWGHDILRNSFCSYALPVFGATQAATWAGNSEIILRNKYLELVDPENARAFWEIRP